MPHDDSDVRILQVTDLARGGAGVAREESGRVIFIPFTAPGDRVRVRLGKADKRYAEAELLEVLKPSPLRVAPRCPAFQKCGGCQWQHLPYELQWATKVKGVKHALDRVGVGFPEPFAELPAQRIWEYRNRVQLRGFKEELGFYAARSHEVVALDRCEIARPEINDAWARAKAEGASLPKPYKVELEVDDGGKTRMLWNARHAAGGFRQVHDEQNEKLQRLVADALPSGTALFDLFGGAGNLSRPLVDRFAEVHCVDLSVPAGRPAGLPEHFRFHASPVLRWLQSQKGRRWEGAAAILDPPREGLAADARAISSALADLGVRRLVLVGCDPDSWARDLSRLTRDGELWLPRRAAVLDLFPHTPHVESIAVLER
ncbi:MAG: TRAM domain-containing protein [Oligoflexia bacterium]|nr:TRAM domain-containing protein [Oligoflexia bacterium]